MTYENGRPRQESGPSHNMNVIGQGSKASIELEVVLRAYIAYGGTWSPCVAGRSAYLWRCPLMCGPRHDGQLWLDRHAEPLPPIWLASYGGDTWLTCMNGCTGDRVLRAVGVVRQRSYGLGIGPRAALARVA